MAEGGRSGLARAVDAGDKAKKREQRELLRSEIEAVGTVGDGEDKGEGKKKKKEKENRKGLKKGKEKLNEKK